MINENQKSEADNSRRTIGVGSGVLLGVWLPGKTLHELVTGCDDWDKLGEVECRGWSLAEEVLLGKFCDAVNVIAENNMLKTGKLEGSHFAAMKMLMAKYA